MSSPPSVSYKQVLKSSKAAAKHNYDVFERYYYYTENSQLSREKPVFLQGVGQERAWDHCCSKEAQCTAQSIGKVGTIYVYSLPVRGPACCLYKKEAGGTNHGIRRSRSISSENGLTSPSIILGRIAGGYGVKQNPPPRYAALANTRVYHTV